ncbi:hypothetical protein ABT297_42555 [Dactylosporangium sp. NPDC000555]|uniref:hypothetical protein n=1 Tax=Dactylosporangium sp. NPDC000555 TaxID=3154260 RepID=UPI003327EC2E
MPVRIEIDRYARGHRTLPFIDLASHGHHMSRLRHWRGLRDIELPESCYANPAVPTGFDHATRRLEQRGVTAGDAQAVLAREPFSYYHEDQWKMGYYDPKSKVFVAKTIDGNVNTVMTNVDQAYINRLRGGR